MVFIGLGIAVLVALGNINEIIPAINTIPILVIVVGCIIFLVAFFGCCGAIRENGCFLIMVTFNTLSSMFIDSTKIYKKSLDWEEVR